MLFASYKEGDIKRNVIRILVLVFLSVPEIACAGNPLAHVVLVACEVPSSTLPSQDVAGGNPKATTDKPKLARASHSTWWAFIKSH